MKAKITKWYKHGLWTMAMVANAVVKGILTAREYEEIIGKTYTEEYEEAL